MENRQKDTLLVVDDIPTNLKVLLSYLSGSNFKVLVAEDGSDALDKVSRTKPDLILLDVMMPHMDGFETCRRLKEDPATQDIPVIFMTALTDTVDKVTGFELGAVDYITKPVQQEEVLARVATHLNIRRLQKALEQKNVELQQQNQELDAFAHTVAHDLKNPLNVITGLSSALLDGFADGLAPEVQTCLQDIQHAGLKMGGIISSLLLLASARMQEVPMQPLDMAGIVAQTRKRLALLIQEYRGELVLPEAWPTALGYAPWIEEIWANYLSNGLKYGGRPPRLELGATPQADGQVRFWVQDNGAGISPEVQQSLFVPFTRIGQARLEGHGLGLSIVQRIIAKCGGGVGVESAPGAGSRFYFSLPAA